MPQASSSLAFALWTLTALKPDLAQSSTPAPIAPDTEIQKSSLRGGENRGVGIAVGVIDARGRRVVTYGNPANDDTRSLDADTIFEIGSIPKSLHVAGADVIDPFSRYLPAGVTVPARGGRAITLQDLATHPSGLLRSIKTMAEVSPTL